MQINTNNSAFLNIAQHRSQADKTLSQIASAQLSKMDNTANAAIADMLGSQLSSLTQGVANGNDATAMMQIADGVLQGVSQSSERLQTLSVAMNNAALDDMAKSALQKEFQSLTQTIDRSIADATYNGQPIFGRELGFSLGNTQISTQLDTLSTENLDISNMQSIEDFRKNIQSNLTEVGSTVQALQSAISNNLEGISSLSAAKSQLSDTDMAKDVMDFNKEKLMLDTAVFAQIHQSDQLKNSMERLLA